MGIDFINAPNGASHYFKRHMTFYRDSGEGVQYYHSSRMEWRRSFVFDSLDDYGLKALPKITSNITEKAECK